MKFLTTLSLLILLAVAPASVAQDNPSPSGDPFIGAYEGTYQAQGRDPYPAKGHIINIGRGVYKVSVGFGVNDGSQQYGYVEIHGEAHGPRLRVSGYSNDVRWNGTVRNGELTVKQDAHYGGAFTMKKVIHHSPTEGMKPQADAVVILPYAEGEPTNLDAMTNSNWILGRDGSMQVKGGEGDQRTKAEFGDCTVHLEFKLAHMPDKSGQSRSNSGIYLQDRYEAQILDSFGLMSGSGDCGGIYEQAVPLVNACYPPGQWQTYDIEFTAARFNADGSVASYPTMTVRLNGVLIHDEHVFESVTGGAVSDKVVAKAPIRLQDHGDPVQYRNFWVVEKD